MKDDKSGDAEFFSPVVRPLKEILREFDLRESEGIRSCIGYPLEEWPLINGYLSGVQRGSLTLVCGSEEKHRSAFLLEWACSLIRSSKVPVIFISFENSSRNILYRLMSRESGLDLDVLMRLKIKGDPRRRAKLQEALAAFASYQGYLHLVPGGGGVRPPDLEELVGALFSRFKSKQAVLVVDSLQRFPSSLSYAKDSSRHLDTLGSLKNIALSLDIPVIVGSSLSSKGMEIDRSESRDPVVLEHCEGCDSFGSVADIGAVLSQNLRDTAELRDQMQKRAEGLGKDAQRLPSLTVVDMRVDAPGEPSGLNLPGDTSVQFMVSNENGLILELGLATDQELVRFNRIDKALGELLDQEKISFKDPSFSSGVGNGSDAGTKTDSFTSPKEKIKLSLKLR